MPVSTPLQTVQRADFLGQSFALFWPCSNVGLDIDNFTVVRSIARLLDRGCFSEPVALTKDGDLIAIVRHMIVAGGHDTVRVTKIEGMLRRLM